MTLSVRVLQRYKEAGGTVPGSPIGYLPYHLVRLLKRTVDGKYQEYAHHPGTESPHLFTYPVNMRFSIGLADLKVLLRNGLNRVQSNDPGKITLYFAEQNGDDEERNDSFSNDMKPR